MVRQIRWYRWGGGGGRGAKEGEADKPAFQQDRAGPHLRLDTGGGCSEMGNVNSACV